MNWFSFRNDASEPSAEINVFGDIGDTITSGRFVSEFGQIPTGRKITLNIDSKGGDVANGFAIHDAVERRRNDVTARIPGMCASIATVIACAASRVVMTPSALFLIHGPSIGRGGNAGDHRKMADWLDKIGGKLLAIYQRKTGRKTADLQRAMEAETLFTAEEAKAWGFCDEVSTAAAVASHGMYAATCAAEDVEQTLRAQLMAETDPVQKAWLARKLRTVRGHDGGIFEKTVAPVDVSASALREQLANEPDILKRASIARELRDVRGHAGLFK